MKAFKFARKKIESLYTGLCSVYALDTVRDPDTKQSKQSEILLLENQPCRISFESNSATVKSNDTVYEKPQSIKLFIAPDLVITPGSKIVVTQNGKTETYKSSGVPRIYVTHQEIVLELFVRWA
ncbi:MAG: hypothetical protein Q4D26_07680 [Clostridia bacterium]|nr:hypothetical protein [Clostridia bacterium]